MKSKAIQYIQEQKNELYWLDEIGFGNKLDYLIKLIKQDLESCYEKSEVLDRDSFEDFVKVLKVEN